MLTYVATNFVRHLTNFRRSVLGCIDASDSESRRTFQHFYSDIFMKFNQDFTKF